VRAGRCLTGDALDYLELLAAVRPDRFDRTAVRWHGRLETEAAVLTSAESQLALAALGGLRVRPSADVVRPILRRSVVPGQRAATAAHGVAA
jgi:hypothetical protein